MAFYQTLNTRKIILPETVKVIENGAFTQCFSEEIVLPDKLESIGDYAFMFCQALTEIQIPETVDYIGINPFVNCFNLASIMVSDKNPNYEIRDKFLIDNKNEKLISYIPDIEVDEEKCSIPDGIKIIGTCALDTSPSIVEIPSSVVKIEPMLSEYCYNGSALEMIVAEKGSYACEWAEERGYDYRYYDSEDWLQ